MKQTALFLTLALSLSACALYHRIIPAPTTAGQVLTILQDAQWGVEEAHTVLWLSDADYQTVSTDLRAAIQAVQGAIDATSARQAARSTLQAVETLLPVGSKVRPYLDAAIGLL